MGSQCSGEERKASVQGGGVGVQVGMGKQNPRRVRRASVWDSSPHWGSEAKQDELDKSLEDLCGAGSHGKDAKVWVGGGGRLKLSLRVRW